MSPFTTIGLEGDRGTLLQQLPSRSGVGQILGPEGRNLVIGRPANLRRWAGNHLGLGKPVAKGKRPPTDLSSIATAVAFAESTSPFHQRLLYERLMEPLVPRAKRRDLKPPAFLHLNPAERFPRLVVRGEGDDLASSFGPFRDRRAAERARTALHKAWPLRPCDFVFEPDPALPLGLGCLYAQVRSCAAPCLARVSEAEYRELAGHVAGILDGSAPRQEDLAAVLPPFVAAAGARGLVLASKKDGAEIYPVVSGAVLEENRLDLPTDALRPEASGVEAALEGVRFEPRGALRDDRPWLLSWLTGKNRGGAYLVLSPSEPLSSLAARVREVLT